jgi:hypothetical protein
MQYVDFRLVRTIFENMGSPRIADIFRRLEEKINSLEPSVWEEYYRTYFEVLDTVVSSLQDKGILSAECYHKIANSKSEAESILKERFSVELDTPPFGSDLAFLKAINYLGIISWYENEGKITFFISPTLIPPLFRFISNCFFNKDEYSLKKHIENVQKVKHPEKGDEDIANIINEAIGYINDFAFKFRKALSEHMGALLSLRISKEQLEDIASIELLPTSTDFYSASIEYFKKSFGKKVPAHFIFSTTSGVMIPEEHFGYKYFTDILKVTELAQRIEKNPYRQDAFEAVREALDHKPIAYYFEKTRASNALKKTYNELRKYDLKLADNYVLDAIRILNKYLQHPNFSFIRVSEFPNVFDYLTIGNSENLILSMRDRSQKIAHGLWVKPKGFALQQAFSDTKEELIKHILSGGASAVASGVFTGDLLQNLAVAFAVGFASLIFYGVRKVWGAVKAKKAVFDIANLIKKRTMDIEIVKDFKENPHITAEELLLQLLE